MRDYFLARWDEFKHLPWGVLAHSTHLKGSGTYEGGVEQPRIQVTLATGISEAETRRAINLGYRDPAAIDPQELRRPGEPRACCYIPKAGEYLYRLKSDA